MNRDEKETGNPDGRKARGNERSNIMRKAAGNSIFGLVNDLQKSPLQQEIDQNRADNDTQQQQLDNVVSAADIDNDWQ